MNNRPSSDPPDRTRIVEPNDLAMVDLLNDPLLHRVPRTMFQGQSVPTLGGIPLLEKLGQGGMGAVYRGVRVMLRQEVAVKVLPLHLAAHQQGLTERFVREAQMAARIESPHLVRVSDVNELDGLFYIVMDLVRGPSAAWLIRQQKEQGGNGMGELAALDLCLAACRGVAAAHAQGIIHRDIKPDNILIPQAGDGELLLSSAKVADLGLARSEESELSLTASSIGMGTPGYMAPEQTMSARHAGKPSDVFGMGATLYALLTGQAPFTGESAASILIATIQQPHRPVQELRPDISDATAQLLDRCLEKDPDHRLPDAAAMGEALESCRNTLTESGEKREALYAPINLRVAAPPAPSPAPRSTGRKPPPEPSPAGVVVENTVRVGPPPRRSRTLALTIAALLLFSVAGALFLNRERLLAPDVIGLACGPEEAEWLRWAAAEFAKTTEGKGTSIEVMPMTAAETERQLLEGGAKIDAWVSTTALTRSAFEQKWRARYNTSPIVRSELLGMTPHVFLMIKNRYDHFIEKFGALSFSTLRTALTESRDWQTIARKPEWGQFAFAITHPATYESGLASLALMAFEHQGQEGELTASHVASPAFTEWARGFAPGFAIEGNPEEVVDTLILKGPSAYDGVVTYESVVVRELEDFEDRWGPAQLVYPAVNIWNETTYFILETPRNTTKSRRVSEDFLQFLLSEPAQKQLVRSGFRPANPHVKIHFEGSPFTTLHDRGGEHDIPIAIEPSIEALEALLEVAATLK